MSLASVARHRAFVTRAGKVKPGDLRRPVRGPLWLREAASEDVTYEEVTGSEVYKPVFAYLTDGGVIVDLGGNVGQAGRFRTVIAARRPGVA
jgi:hypothetical protein